MFYQAELDFLCNTLEKCQIKTTFLNPNIRLSEQVDIGLQVMLQAGETDDKSFFELVNPVEEATIYKMIDSFSATYLFFLLPNKGVENLILIGPYLTGIPSTEQIMELAEKNGIPPKYYKQIEAYYGSIPLLAENNQIFAMLDSFGEIIWGGVDKFTFVDINKEITYVPQMFSKKEENTTEDFLWDMKMMENRYAYENEMIKIVSEGRVHKIDMMFSHLSNLRFEQRLADPVRNGKNYCIIMNTLLRKGAEQGGVHPLYLDSVSSNFAMEIEQMTSEKAIHELMQNMFRTYCVLVKKHSTKGFSAPVQKTITYIDSDIGANISTSMLANMQNVSASYLSSIFKKETGKSITEYINLKRVEMAKDLLKKTNLQVQTIAQHCGIMDMNYFSKVFKKYTGKTPKEYRESFRKNKVH
ncbi:MAG: AraC family transcriptional regulator [Lachnospiraceae bacterium]|nr:AraC family transcriptional regulator [Lachnospiraceae bacterium]